MPRPLRIALVQFAPLPPDHAPDASAQNLARAHAFVLEAVSKGATLIVFPEYFLSGIVEDPAHWGLAQRSHDLSAIQSHTPSAPHWLESFRLLAIEHKVSILPGTIIESTVEEGKTKLWNVAHYINSEGEVVGRYRKEHLWHPEKEYLCSGGEGSRVFETEWGRVGMLICWDLAWPESFRALLLQKLDIAIIPTFWTAADGDALGLAHNPDCEALYLDTTIVARTFENECAIIFVNCGGTIEEGMIGRSGVAVPFKGWLKQTKSGEEEMLMVDLELGSILHDARKVYGIRKDLIKIMSDAGTLPADVDPVFE